MLPRFVAQAVRADPQYSDALGVRRRHRLPTRQVRAGTAIARGPRQEPSSGRHHGVDQAVRAAGKHRARRSELRRRAADDDPARRRAGVLRRRARSGRRSPRRRRRLPVCEALAELTLAILQKDRQRDEALGWTRDLPLYVHQALPWLLDRRTRAHHERRRDQPGRRGTRLVVGALRGADAAGSRWRPSWATTSAGTTPSSGCPRARCSPTRTSVRARSSTRCDAGADIVITGRVADASLFLAPLVHEHGWAWDDWDRLAAGVVVGHLLECCGQVTGGNYSGAWWENPDPLRIGFPIGEVEADGSAVITKPGGTGGWSRSTRSASNSSTRCTIRRRTSTPT